jgi:flagellar assembly protein FliH
MAGIPTIQLAGPIESARITGVWPEPMLGMGTQQAEVLQDLETQRAELTAMVATIRNIAARLNDFCNKLIVEHREAIAKLAVEIARKILVQKVQEKDYKIEAIVKEALNSAPTRKNVVVHLNPLDLADLHKLAEQDTEGTFTGVEFVADNSIGRAECLLETPKGIIESLIDRHLEQINRALALVSA